MGFGRTVRSFLVQRSRGRRILAITCAVVMAIAALWWSLPRTGGMWLRVWPPVALFVLFCAAAWCLRKVVRWQAANWVPAYLCAPRSSPEVGKPIDVCFLFVDHFEPEWNRASAQVQVPRVVRWEELYSQAIKGHADSDGRPPQHTWFFPVATEAPEAAEGLARWPGYGWGEIEYHLHHPVSATEEEIGKQIREDIASLQRLGAVPTGRYGFVHGMFSLAAGDRRSCNAPGELDVLMETGCYADFTFPALNTPAQPRLVNTIYYARSTGQPKPYDCGVPAEVGRRNDGLLMIPGPMCFGMFPRVLDDADVGPNYPPSPRRVYRWVDAHVHVRGRPNWVFVTIHAHTAIPRNCEFLFGGAMQRTWTELEARYKRDGARLHYVTAREAYNIVRAAEAGMDGNPDAWRDFEIPPPLARTTRLGSNSLPALRTVGGLAPPQAGVST